jgi:hypothetical protein
VTRIREIHNWQVQLRPVLHENKIKVVYILVGLTINDRNGVKVLSLTQTSPIVKVGLGEFQTATGTIYRLGSGPEMPESGWPAKWAQPWAKDNTWQLLSLPELAIDPTAGL